MSDYGWLSESEVTALREWLPHQEPRVWHQVALSWNWDNGTEFLDWILDQPTCDAGTAISLYLSGEPDFYESYASLEAMREDERAKWHLPTAEFLARICERWNNGHFKTYHFHPGDWFDRSYGWGEVPPGMIRGTAPWPVPADMAAQPLRGEFVDASRFTEGMPNSWIPWTGGTPYSARPSDPAPPETTPPKASWLAKFLGR